MATPSTQNRIRIVLPTLTGMYVATNVQARQEEKKEAFVQSRETPKAMSLTQGPSSAPSLTDAQLPSHVRLARDDQLIDEELAAPSSESFTRINWRDRNLNLAALWLSDLQEFGKTATWRLTEAWSDRTAFRRLLTTRSRLLAAQLETNLQSVFSPKLEPFISSSDYNRKTTRLTWGDNTVTCLLATQRHSSIELLAGRQADDLRMAIAQDIRVVLLHPPRAALFAYPPPGIASDRKLGMNFLTPPESRSSSFRTATTVWAYTSASRTLVPSAPNSSSWTDSPRCRRSFEMRRRWTVLGDGGTGRSGVGGGLKLGNRASESGRDMDGRRKNGKRNEGMQNEAQRFAGRLGGGAIKRVLGLRLGVGRGVGDVEVTGDLEARNRVSRLMVTKVAVAETRVKPRVGVLGVLVSTGGPTDAVAGAEWIGLDWHAAWNLGQWAYVRAWSNRRRVNSACVPRGGYSAIAAARLLPCGVFSAVE
ncbi:hypothetical protein C8F01DRAFT_1308582 [Mycena amicta]|nr:hypothetical protein C8F01DRAFT_1308582 [Mycena amicta]